MLLQTTSTPFASKYYCRGEKNKNSEDNRGLGIGNYDCCADSSNRFRLQELIFSLSISNIVCSIRMVRLESFRIVEEEQSFEKDTPVV